MICVTAGIVPKTKKSLLPIFLALRMLTKPDDYALSETALARAG